MNVSGAHADLDGKLPIVLGTIPLATSQAPNTAPYTDTVPQQPPAPIQDPSLAPTQPVSPASPPGAANAGGWNLYPSIRKSNSLLQKYPDRHFIPSVYFNFFQPHQHTLNLTIVQISSIKMNRNTCVPLVVKLILLQDIPFTRLKVFHRCQTHNHRLQRLFDTKKKSNSSIFILSDQF